jgi:hypothetical protein
MEELNKETLDYLQKKIKEDFNKLDLSKFIKISDGGYVEFDMRLNQQFCTHDIQNIIYEHKFLKKSKKII